MEQTAVTTQPLRSEPVKEVNASYPITDATGHSEKEENDYVKDNHAEPLTEVTAIFDSDTGQNEEQEKKRQQNWQEDAVTDCCCVYTGNSDPFCIYILCHWICDCFRGIGQCTESCFEGCADCLSNCCEGEAGDCCCDGDCMSSCLECCSSDDINDIADCLSGCLGCCSSCDCAN